jgi:hypothetical protein
MMLKLMQRDELTLWHDKPCIFSGTMLRMSHQSNMMTNTKRLKTASLEQDLIPNKSFE